MKYGFLFWFFGIAGCGTAREGDVEASGTRVLQHSSGDENSVVTGSTCSDVVTSAADDFAPAAEQPGSTAVSKDSPTIVGWADAVVDIDIAGEVSEAYRHAERALGPAEGTSTDVVSLGEGGVITVRFASPFRDGPGNDLCIFENSFSDNFLEFAFVEVASDAGTFVRFGAWSRVASAVDPYATIDPTLVLGLAGKYRQGFCTPFDLAELSDRPEVIAGQLDLSAVLYVRIRDIVGDGRELDCAGAPIFDPFPTTGGAGFDLDAIALLSNTQ
ncbi:MAG TPA: hypothetical protein VIV60_10510 [Polyangiaceae bacterium]